MKQTYPPERQMVSHTAYPNQDVYKYNHGKAQHTLLESNDPELLAEAHRRKEYCKPVRKLRKVG